MRAEIDAWNFYCSAFIMIKKRETVYCAFQDGRKVSEGIKSKWVEQVEFIL